MSDKPKMYHYAISLYGCTRCGFPVRIDNSTVDANRLDKVFPQYEPVITCDAGEVTCEKCLISLRKEESSNEREDIRGDCI